MATSPTKATLRAFNVGFGDCFLLSFAYAKDSRHVLIDFGSTRAPPGAAKNYMADIAAKIGLLTNNKLHMVVATHRHKDHISGFATTAKGKSSGRIIAGLKPELVLQPWTEDPDIAEDATGPAAGPRAFVRSLAGMNGFAEQVHRFTADKSPEQGRKLGFSESEWNFLGFVGENNVSNKSAVKNLMTMGKRKPRYLHAGQSADISGILPGVELLVLGPPTVDQHPNVSQQKAENAEQYWQLASMRGVAGGLDSGGEPGAQPVLFPGHAVATAPHARWAEHRLAKMRKDMLFSMVTALDDAMNNTSLILLFRAGGKSLLFPGDAQWENWQYALSNPAYVKLLKEVDLYKVGHHGSRNATPKSLWELFNHKHASKGKKGRLVSVMSTMHNVHGESAATAVPRQTLVDELEKHSHHYSTENVEKGTLFTPIEFDL